MIPVSDGAFFYLAIAIDKRPLQIEKGTKKNHALLLIFFCRTDNFQPQG